ncbi:uncharacterized protein Z518_07650 [Rhinocladiella mackenziei CBS 650.93]|uniref:Uncharacterized protein n=1 Tax=Rhinocladiella mackenziei CBS 650.93 TaxID=1442369 RepID=A0A0D2FPI7_9EURO|nr:uncharacterized protein Z518_07650 [Rhinocladiella mackenziei CBS 650.93]KIX04097.1 hypothetical protein Z518_07650 [Rhinocladiella mackenziei CBS 650.93]
MPRQAHGRPLNAAKPKRAPKKRRDRNRRQNALEIAEQEYPDEIRIRQHRLGEVEDDSDDPYDREDVGERSSKRRKITTAQEDEAAEEGSDLDGNRWHVGVEGDEEDSDIDSDDAFGQSDEERFADFTFRGTSTSARPKKQGHKIDLDESGSVDEEDEDFGDDGVDLATAWDMDDEAESDAATKKRKHSNHLDDDDDEDERSDSDSRGEDSSADEDDDQSQLSVTDDEGDHSRLQSFVEGLAASGEARASKGQKTTKILSDKPSQFGLSSSKISAAELLHYVKDTRQRQSLKILQNREVKGNEVYQNGIPGKLAPPLAKRQQDRLNRSAAYEESKKELSKWIETVKRNRRAEHISFPLEDPAAAGMLNNKQLGPTSQSKPMNSLESTIQDIMIESGMVSKGHRSPEEQEQADEELHEKRMPLEEVQARRAELRRARDLMFREEIKARRIKKIKSKAYRRVHRKERAKANLENRSLLVAQGLIDSDEEREKSHRRRAEERMGARHRESKWAKSVKTTGRVAWDDDARHGVADLARRDEELRRRIEGKTGGGSGESESESGDSDELSGTDDEKERLQMKLTDFEQDGPGSIQSRLGSMAFMKKAEAARKAANDEEIRNIRRSLREEDGELGGNTDSENEAPAGRRKFGYKTKAEESTRNTPVQRSEFEERESDSEFDQENKRELDEEPMVERRSSAVITPHQPVSQPSKTAGTEKANPSTRASKLVKSQRKEGRVPETELNEYTSPSESEDEQDSKAALAQAIFAGPDEVEQDFAREKRETVEEEGDQVIDNSLPGWGSWTGEGISKKAQKRAQGRFLTITKGVAHDKRRDAKLERVIINEKQVKKNSKYLASELPHPFESRQQYERSLRLPLGPEWTTKSTFQDGTKPRVLLKQGIIRPMARPMI